MVESVAAGSAAATAGIEPGDAIISLDGHPLHDVIDYQFYLEPGRQSVELERGGRRLTLVMDNRENDNRENGGDPGIIFSGVIFDRVRTCPNRCAFCFIEQVPAGLRPPLYLRDDDFRLSFLYGNFITLNNLREDDLGRMIEQRLSPLYVSVHATDSDTRAGLMGCGAEVARRGLANLKQLGEAGIEIHVQVVLCPGINDGEVLERTVRELREDYHGVASVGVVPVALDEEYLREHRESGLRPVTDAESAEVVDAVAAWQEEFRGRRRFRDGRQLHGQQQIRGGRGCGFVYAADEFFLRGRRPLPPPDYYDDFAQFENGIGIAVSFMEEGEEQIGKLLAGRLAAASAHVGSPSTLDTALATDSRARVFLLTGTLAADIMAAACARLSRALAATIKPLAAANRLFGPHVTVTGLLGGRDILNAAAAAGLNRGDLLLIPAACLDGGAEPRFLDDFTLEELQEATLCEVIVAPR